MFQRFTEVARQVVVLAQEEADRLGDGYIGTEHLVLGLAAEDRGLAARLLREAGVGIDELRVAVARRGRSLDAEALATIGIDLEAVRRAVEATFGPGALTRGRACAARPFSREAKRVLELALREALALGHSYIGTEHILLGVARAGGEGLELLEEQGIRDVRRLVLDAIAA